VKKMAVLMIGCTLLMLPFGCLSWNFGGEKVQLRLEDLIERMASQKWPASYRFFSDLGVSSFRQVNGSDSLNIAFRSGSIGTDDGYELQFIEYRVSPALDGGIRFLYLKLSEGRCYKPDGLRSKFKLERYFLPPSPHANATAEHEKASMYKIELGEADLSLKASLNGDCLLSVSRGSD
jgi:hypothetical protein